MKWFMIQCNKVLNQSNFILKVPICQKIIVMIQKHPKLVSVKELGHSSNTVVFSLEVRRDEKTLTSIRLQQLRGLRGLTIWNHIFVCGKGKIYWEREIENRACVKFNLTLNQDTNLAPKGQEVAAAGIFARELYVRRTRHWHERYQSIEIKSYV